MQFNDRPELSVPFTTDTDQIQSALTFTQSRGRTALLDSVYLAMHEMKKAKNSRKAILIISDGGDNSSRYTETEIKNAVREADVQIFAIGIFESCPRAVAHPRKRPDPGLLNELPNRLAAAPMRSKMSPNCPTLQLKLALSSVTSTSWATRQRIEREMDGIVECR